MPKKSPEQWSAVVKGLEDFYSDERNVGTVPTRKMTLGKDIANWRERGAIPADAPPRVSELAEQHGVLKTSNPVTHKTPKQWSAVVKGLEDFYSGGKNGGKALPHSHTYTAKDGTLVNLGLDLRNWGNNRIPQEAPDDAREAIERYLATNFKKNPAKRKTPKQWSAVVKGLEDFYSGGKNDGKVPLHSHTYTAKDGTLVNLGLDLRNWENNGIPKGAPDDVKEVIKWYLDRKTAIPSETLSGESSVDQYALPGESFGLGGGSFQQDLAGPSVGQYAPPGQPFGPEAGSHQLEYQRPWQKTGNIAPGRRSPGPGN